MADINPTATAPSPPADEAPSSPLEKFLEKNFKKIVIALGLVVLVLLAVSVSRYFSRQTEMQAAQEFTAAKTVEDCDVVAQKYAGTRAAGNALLLKATLLWEAGKKESSVTVLKDFIKDRPDHSLLPYAEVALGSKLAALGEKDEARKTLDAVVRDHPKSEMAAAADTQLGDMLWAEGKVDEAKKLFADFPRNYPGSPFISEVEQRTKMMAAGLPSKEVDPPPPPPKSAETPKPALTPVPAIPKPSSTTPTIEAPSLTAPPTTAPSAPSPLIPAPAPPPKAEEKAPAPAPPATPKVEEKPAPAAPPAAKS